MTARRPRVGSIVQLALPNGQYAYGRVLNDASVGFYRTMSRAPNQPPSGDREYAFVVGVYEDVLGSLRAPVVAYDPSESPEHDWPPPTKIRDPITGAFSIYSRGKITPATSSDAEQLETAGAWDYDHLVERLLRLASQN